MNVKMTSGWAALLVPVVFVVGALAADEPQKLTEGEQKLAREALRLNEEGVQLYREARLADAVLRLRKSVELLDKVYPRARFPKGHPDLASSVNNLGAVLKMQGEYAQAEPLYRRAVEMDESLYPRDKYPNGHADLSNSLNNLAILLKVQGEYDLAEPLYKRALAMDEALHPKDRFPNGHSRIVQGLNNLALLMEAQGEYEKAEPLLRRALDMSLALFPKEEYPQGHPILAESHSSLGHLLRSRGELAQAEPLYRRALQMREALYSKERFPRGHPHLATSFNNLAFLFHERGEFEKAEPLYRHALEMREALYPKEGYPQGHPDLAHSLNNLGVLLQEREQYAQAEPLGRRAVQMNESLYPKEKYPLGHPDLANSLSNLSQALRAQGVYDQSEVLTRRSLEMREKLFPKDKYPQGHLDLAGSVANLSCLLWAQGKYAQAEPMARRALEMYQNQATQAARTAPEARALNLAATFPLMRDFLLSLARHLPGSDLRMYDTVWHSKAGVSRVYQRRHLALISAATDPDVRSAWDRLQHLRRRREQLLLAPAAKNAAARDTKLLELQMELDEVEKSLLPRLPALKHIEDLAALGPDAVRQRLADGEAFVDFLRYTYFEQDPGTPGDKGEKRTPHYLAFIVGRHGIRRIELGPAAEVESAIGRWREAIMSLLSAEQEKMLARLESDLRARLWSRIEAELPAGTRTIYLSPDAALTRLPWAALPGRANGNVLLDDYALAIVPHGPFLLEQLTPPPPRSNKRPPAPDGMLVVGGVQYDHQLESAQVAPQHGADTVVDQKVTWNYLKGTEQERMLLHALLERNDPKLTVSLSGREATVARLRSELARCRYAHMATHGFFADKQFRSVMQLDEKLFARREYVSGHLGERIGEGARSPLVLSGLVCAGANRTDTPERGILSADAIAGLLLDDLHLAVLSACDTGLGDVAGGEGVYGLQRAFHIAGCKNVIASLWKVSDAATAALMAKFYHEMWVNKQPPLAALREAQLTIYRHPERISALAGERGKPDQAKTVELKAEPAAPTRAAANRTPTKLWAAFVLSGVGK